VIHQTHQNERKIQNEIVDIQTEDVESPEKHNRINDKGQSPQSLECQIACLSDTLTTYFYQA
jgi:hypothetical protein